MPKGMIKPTIVTGLEALGRGNDRTKLVLFLQTLQQNLGAETIGQYVNLSEAIKRLATADGIETKGLIKSEEDLQGEMAMQQQQAQEQALRSADQQLAFAQQQQPLNLAQQLGQGVTSLIAGYPAQFQSQNIPTPSPLQTALGAGATLAGVYRAFS